jgi:hypothetical protein
MTEAGAAEHLDALDSKYAGRPARFFGDAIPASFAQTETPVLCQIRCAAACWEGKPTLGNTAAETRAWPPPRTGPDPGEGKLRT